MSQEFNFKLEPIHTTKDLDALTKSNNQKYGDFDSNTRSLDKRFIDTFTNTLKGEFNNVIVCGANKGEEVKIIKDINPTAEITALDISDVALEKLHNTEGLQDVKCLHKDLENTTANDKQFDIYVALRTIPSSNVDMAKALNEAMRITKNKIVLSVPNGYVIDGKIFNGMYEYEGKTIDKTIPFEIREELAKYFELHGWGVTYGESDGDLFITAIPTPGENAHIPDSRANLI
ncbi:MAG: methyltransferase domain-containing protein [Candidatus Magasanikiibacteriota bacterium]